MKKITIITVNYNTDNETENLLRSIEKLEKKDFDLKIIIVDNGSKTLFKLNPQNKKENIIVHRSDKNLGFAGGYNLGMKLALQQQSDYILIINNDTLVQPDLLKNLINVLDQNPSIGAAVPKIYFAKGHEFHKDRYRQNELGKVIWYAGGYTDWDNVKSVHHGMDEVDQGQYDKIESTEFATGCCILFKKDVLEKVGLFDERYFLYYEDADLSERVKKAGYKIMYVPQANLIHINAASSGGPGSNLHDYFLTRNQMLFGMTYAPMRTKLALVKQSLRLLLNGRPYQKRAIRDFYSRKFGEGSFFKNP
jgi:GT2 family glycosyltransferase